jgi:integrase
MGKVAFTRARVEGFKCPADKGQAFLWDATQTGLGLRVTPLGKPAYVFQAVYLGRDVRITIGSPEAWSIPEAQARARVLQREIDEGRDPRALKQSAQQASKAKEAKDARESVVVRDAWARYITEGRPKRRAAWKPRYVADMAAMISPGGEPKKRGKGKTLPGHLHPLLGLRLCDVDEDRLATWFAEASKRSAHQATRALMMFRGFLRWCAARPEYRLLVNRDAGKAPAILECLPAVEKRTDSLELAQLSGWWSAVSMLPNQTASAYLRALLLTGARREEIARLKWDAVDFRWHKLTLADKVDETRTLPLTRYLAMMLARLPRQKMPDGTANPYVFASSSKVGRIVDPRSSMERANREAEIVHLTIHGLRRSFALLGEAAGAPAGAIAQAMGHKPSAVHEGYKPRSLDALRPYLDRVEAFILETAGVQFDPSETN